MEDLRLEAVDTVWWRFHLNILHIHFPDDSGSTNCDCKYDTLFFLLKKILGFEILFPTVIKPRIASLLVSWTVDGTGSETKPPGSSRKTSELSKHCRKKVWFAFRVTYAATKRFFSGSSLIWGLEHGHGIYYHILFTYIYIYMYASFLHSRDGTFLRNLLTSWEIGCLKIAVLFCPEALQIGVPSWCDKPTDLYKKEWLKHGEVGLKGRGPPLVLCITR